MGFWWQETQLVALETGPRPFFLASSGSLNVSRSSANSASVSNPLGFSSKAAGASTALPSAGFGGVGPSSPVVTAVRTIRPQKLAANQASIRTEGADTWGIETRLVMAVTPEYLG